MSKARARDVSSSKGSKPPQTDDTTTDSDLGSQQPHPPPPVPSDPRTQQMFALLPSLSLSPCLQPERALYSPSCFYAPLKGYKSCLYIPIKGYKNNLFRSSINVVNSSPPFIHFCLGTVHMCELLQGMEEDRNLGIAP